jgi:hypothetical protein
VLSAALNKGGCEHGSQVKLYIAANRVNLKSLLAIVTKVLKVLVAG